MYKPQTIPSHGNDNSVSMPVAENAIEIAMNCLEFLQDNLEIGRDAILREYVLPWAHEAETKWMALQTSNTPGDYDKPYYDFIDDFSSQKKAEFLQAQMP